ncbi:MAG: hypothetical protein M1822_010090 [Bathelium mastoideum]|nr:MAG: hypothetical protein M1822_010090 [Bathelium mastoideum]
MHLFMERPIDLLVVAHLLHGMTIAQGLPLLIPMSLQRHEQRDPAAVQESATVQGHEAQVHRIEGDQDPHLPAVAILPEDPTIDMIKGRAHHPGTTELKKGFQSDLLAMQEREVQYL